MMSKKIAVSSNDTSKLSLPSSAASVLVVASNVDLLAEILVRVPAKSLLRFKSVCKEWRSLITDSRFSRNHATRQNPHPLPSGIYFYSKRDRSLSLNDQITHLPVNGHPRTSLPNFSFLDGVGYFGTKLLHSSNGMMLCSTGEKGKDYVVCNLTTQKFAVLPTLAAISKSYCTFQSYLVFDPKKSPYYKVAVVIFALDLDTSLLVVYSSGTSSWNSGPRIQDTGSETYGAIWNGAILLLSCVGAWRNCAEHDHVYLQFDIDTEKLTTARVPPPDTNLSKEIMYFGECGGRLLRIQIQHNATDFNVLEMIIDGDDNFRWALKYRVDLAPLISLPRRKTGKFMVVSVTKVGEDENDLAVVLYVGRKVVQYNVKCKTLTVLCDLPGRYFASIVHPYMHSFHFIESLAPL